MPTWSHINTNVRQTIRMSHPCSNMDSNWIRTLHVVTHATSTAPKRSYLHDKAEHPRGWRCVSCVGTIEKVEEQIDDRNQQENEANEHFWNGIWTYSRNAIGMCSPGIISRKRFVRIPVSSIPYEVTAAPNAIKIASSKQLDTAQGSTFAYLV